MKCKSCNAEIDDLSQKCEYCGASTSALTPPDSSEVIEYNKKEEQTDVIFCSKCGKKLAADSLFCTSCGHKLEVIPNEVASQDLTQAAVQNKSEEIKKAEMFGNINIGTGNEQSVNIDNNVNYHRYSNNGFNSKTTRIGTFIFIFVFLFMVGMGVSGILIFRGDLFGLNKGKKTLMVYMVGSNLETTYGLASLDIAEMINARYDLNNVNILLYTGGAKQWQTPEISSEDHGVFLITTDGIEKVKSFEKEKMGLSTTLSRFLNYAYDNYKAEKYGLILWDHGGGPINGYGADEFYKFDFLTITELRQAIEDSPFKDKKFEFVGFDACLMSSVEVANAISDYSRYFISSEENEPGNGWNYEFLESINPGDDGKTIGRNIADYFADYYSQMDVDGVTIAVMDLEKIDKVENSINSLFSEINSNLDTDFSSISRARSAAKEFGRDSNGSFDLIDVYDFVDKLPSKYSTQKENLKSALSDAVIYFNTDIQGANGLSMYFPYFVRNKFDKSLKMYKTFDFANEYLKFSTNFTNKLIGVRRNTFDLDDMTPVLLEDNKVELEMTEDMVENYSKVTYRIFEKLDNGNYVPRFQGTDYNIEGNKITTTINKKGITATDKEGNTINLMAFEAERGIEYVKYLIPGTIEDYDGEKYTSIPVFIHFVVSKDNPNGKIEGITRTEPELDISSKTLIDLSNVSKVMLVGTAQYKIFDDNGKYMHNWESVTTETIEAIEEDLTKIKIEFTNLDMTKEYYFLFEIEDSQGNAYTTNPVKISK